MRAYFFGNFYLSSIQQGIQAQHCTAEMFVKYGAYKNAYDVLHQWAYEHKTSILLNGGDQEALVELWHLLRDEDNPYPWAKFEESKGALNEALTCVGIILPEEIYTDAEEFRKRRMELWQVHEKHGDWGLELITTLNSCGLAR